MQILKFRSDEELVARAHDTVYGLAASVYTKDVDRAVTMAHSLQAGTVW